MELITYETIRNAHRAEKEEELQRLPIGFFESVRNWFSHKEKLKDTTSLLEVENAKKLLEDIVNRREKKIVLSALRTVRGEMPPSSLTDEERKFFDQVVTLLKGFRNDINEKFRNYADIVEEKMLEAKKSLDELKPEIAIVEPEEPKVSFAKPNGKVMVKAKMDMPRFVGSDMESYGPLKAGDVLYVPDEVGKLLINRKVVENILE
jgi:DNA replication initiation complex subunit (GINS family)